MSLQQTNAELLSQKYPELLEEILREDDIDISDIEIESTASGHATLKFRGLYIHSNRDPVREARRLAESIAQSPSAVTANSSQEKQNSVIVILGFGLGYAAKAAAELWPDRPLIIVEKYRSLLRIAMEQLDMKTLLSRPNVVFVNGGSGDGITGALSLFEETDNDKAAPSVIRNYSLAGLDSQWYKGVENRIRTWTMRNDVNSATRKRFGRRWIRNLSSNISFIRDRPGISRLAGVAKDIPVFLAAAGPGLDQAGPFLSDIAERCIVVAVDTSLRFLHARGVIPHFTVIVDPQFWNSRHLDRLSLEKTRLLAESAVYPPVLRLPFKGVYLCGSLFPLGSFIEKRVDPKGSLGAGGSVATTAWDFCRILGPQNIWIAGLDLAFPDNKTHFRGAAFEEKSHAQSCRFLPSETWLVRSLRDGIPFRAPGSTVLTDRRLSLYAAWFENRFCRYPDIRNYSLSSGGLAINGLENASIDSLLSLPKRRKEIDSRIEAALSQIESDFYNEENTRQRADSYETAVSALLQGLERIKASAEKGAGIAEQAMKRTLNRTEKEKILKSLDEINHGITGSELYEVAGFLFPAAEAKNTVGSLSDPFRAYLCSSASFYHSLAETVEINLQALVSCPSICNI